MGVNSEVMEVNGGQRVAISHHRKPLPYLPPQTHPDTKKARDVLAGSAPAFCPECSPELLFSQMSLLVLKQIQTLSGELPPDHNVT
ncbi:hypothetical protein NQZ68_019509, partial [Dissostichus eleginoides]